MFGKLIFTKLNPTEFDVYKPKMLHTYMYTITKMTYIHTYITTIQRGLPNDY